MDMALCSLYSGSTGNATFVATGDGAVLVDAGGTARRLLTALGHVEACPQDIRGILVTHEHIDHIGAIGPLCRKHSIPVYATAGTWAAMEASGKLGTLPPVCKVVLQSDCDFFLAGMRITAHPTSHDAAEPVCYTFSRNGHQLAVATDTGYVSATLANHLFGCELILLESNHDVTMLQQNPRYPATLKRRILGRHGHLSNEDSASLGVRLRQAGTRTLVLAHLSQQNNTCGKAFDAHAAAQMAAGFIPGRDLDLGMTWPDHPSHIYCL